MREPKITSGFIVFRKGYETEIPRGQGHWEVAKKWVEQNNFLEEFKKVRSDLSFKIYDYDDFLTDFIGAIRLYNDDGKPYCYIPRGNNNENKSFLKHYFYNKKVVRLGIEYSFTLIGDVDEEISKTDTRELSYIPVYNQTLVVDRNGRYCYNPNRMGD